MKWPGSARSGLMLFGLVISLSFVLSSSVSADDAEGMRPIADAGSSRYAAQDPVQLDGSGSYAPDDSGPLSYAWTQTSGPPVVITGADTATPSISGFVQTEQIQECDFELIVSDGQSASSPDTTKVVVVPTFTNCTMTLENAAFDCDKPTVIFFHGGSSEQTGGGRLGDSLWSQKANIISFPSYIADPGTFSGAQTERSYQRPGDRIIVYLSAVAPDYCQPIQTFGWSIGGLLALDVPLRLNLTYADARYAVNHACLLDPSAWVMGTPEFHRRVALLLANPVAGEQCWVASYEAANASVCPSALNVVFAADHALPWNYYRTSLVAVEDTPFNHGVVAGAYWSVLGPGRNLQLASTPGIETYKFGWIGSATSGRMELYQPLNHPGRLPEPVTLGAWINLDDGSGDVDGAILSCHESENAVDYELLLGSDPYRVMDFRVASRTPLPPMSVTRDFLPEETWWTIRVHDQYGSSIHADPVPLDLSDLAPATVHNARTGKRYGLVAHAFLEAEPGDTILLDPALYEENITFPMPLTVSSLDPSDPAVVADTIIEGRDAESTVTFAGSKSAGCTLAGLTIRGESVGISCRDAVPTIQGCVVESPDGIAIDFWHGGDPRLIDCDILGDVAEVNDPMLIAHWRLDEFEGVTAHDIISGQDGAFEGDPVWQPDGGMVAGALLLDGIDDCIETALKLNPGAGPFGVFLWVKGGAPGEVLVSQYGGAKWLMVKDDGVLATELSGPAGAGALVSQVSITDGNWHRVGLTWDGAFRTLYVDDVEVAQDTCAGLDDRNGILYIGASGPTRSRAPTFFSGLVDDVRIYDRAITP